MVKHVPLSGNTLKLGQFHWYLVRADAEMQSKRYVHHDNNPFQPHLVERTEFGEEVGRDEIYWWVSRREKDLEELRVHSERALQAAQLLKEASAGFPRILPRSYDDLVTVLDRFASDHSSEIEALYDYVSWLYEKDALAPVILFTYRVWGATRLADRCTKIEGKTVEVEEPRKIEELARLVLGLRQRDWETVVPLLERLTE